MAGDEYRKANYKPTLNQKLKIQQAKDALQSWQGNILSNQKLWQQAYDVIQKDKMKGDYDEKHFWDKTNEFYDSGILPTDLLSPKPYENIDAELLKMKYNGKIVKNITTYDKNGNAYTHEAEVVADEKERKDLLAGMIHDNVRMGASAMKEFSELPMETKKKYLDDAEENKENAIINYFYDKHNESYAPKLSMNKVAPVRQQGIGISSVSSIEDEPVGNVPVKSTRKDATGEALISKAPILRQGNISQATTVSISGMNEWDKNTGEKQPLKKAGEYTTLKDISIVYMPVKNDRWVQQDAYKVNGKLRPGVEIKPFVQGKSNKGRVTYFEYTPEVQDKINAAIPSTKKKISEEDFPFEWKPTESEIKPQKVKKVTYTIKGKTYTHQNLDRKSVV
jgi:hypothetical protein